MDSSQAPVRRAIRVAGVTLALDPSKHSGAEIALGESLLFENFTYYEKFIKPVVVGDDGVTAAVDLLRTEARAFIASKLASAPHFEDWVLHISHFEVVGAFWSLKSKQECVGTLAERA